MSAVLLAYIFVNLPLRLPHRLAGAILTLPQVKKD